MTNYKPITKVLLSAEVISGVALDEDLSTSNWGIILFTGIATSPSSGILRSATVVIWESTNPTTSPPNHITYSDKNGKYGVTVRTSVSLKIRYYPR